MAYIDSIHISILGTKRNRTNKYRIRLSSGGNIYIAETKQPQILNCGPTLSRPKHGPLSKSKSGREVGT